MKEKILAILKKYDECPDTDRYDGALMFFPKTADQEGALPELVDALAELFEQELNNNQIS